MSAARLRGYIFSREIAGSLIPQRVQNLVIRDYCARQGAVFLLSNTAYYMPDCYMMLDATLRDLASIDGIVFYSLEMLPEDPLRRRALFDAVLDAGREFRFALEELAVRTSSDCDLVEEILAVKKLAVTPHAI